MNSMKFTLITLFGLFLGIQSATAQWVQEGPKLVGTGAVGSGSQGCSVATSSDGNTAIVGGLNDNGDAGAAWIWTRSGGVWTQQGAKLVGTGAVGSAQQGRSVSISSDGNTAIVGGPIDNYFDGNQWIWEGAAWIWTRSGGVWTQQGPKLVGTGSSAGAQQGTSVSISGDGNTAIVGGPTDNAQIGAAWIWTRSGGVWTQQGPKLVGSGGVGWPQQGFSVSLSGDGNTAAVGARFDALNGAVWIWTRSGGVWTQQGPKLVGTGAVGNATQGYSVSISSDGNTVIVGGSGDQTMNGAAWIWTRSGGVWTQQGSKLVGSGAIGSAWQGNSVSISSDGNTATVGGPADNTSEGAAWIWTRSGGVWTQQGPKLVGTGAIGSASQGYSVSISANGTTALVGGNTDDGSVGAAWVFTAAAPGASQLAFVQQPTTTVAGATISPAVTVQLQDGSGNPVSTAGVTVTLSLTSGTGALSGTLSQLTNSSGLATFDNLSIDLVGSKQLTAASTSFTSAVSSLFNITAGAAAIITVTGGGTQSTSIGTLFALPLQVTVTDALLNPVSGALVSFSAPGSGASAVVSNGGSATTDANGHASVTATANLVAGGPYTVTATVGTLPPVNFSLTNLPGAVSAIPTLGGVGLIGFALLLAAVGILGTVGAFKS